MARKITESAIAHFMTDKSFGQGNTSVTTDAIETKLYLFGNCIAVKNKETGQIKITLAGWNTATTRERLNGIPGVSISQKKYIPYLNGIEIDIYKWCTITN